MKAYRLINTTNDEIIFGVDNFNHNAILTKLNHGTKTIRPYKHAVAYYNDAMFAFISFNAFKYFLFNICKFDYEDIKLLELLGYKVVEEELECYSKGLSKLFCIYFDNEVVELKEVSLTKLFNNADSCDYCDINQPYIPKEIIKECKDRYYKNIKFKN